MMSDMKLYFFPRACSGVTMTALDMAGVEYDRQLINIFKGEQKTPDYLAINPSGAVPTLLVDGKPIYENASILIYLDMLAPDAGILPSSDDPAVKARYRSDLVRCSATLHPMMRQIRMPMRFTSDAHFDGIYADGTAKLNAGLAPMEAQLTGKSFLYGDEMSIVDVYLRWIMRTAMSAGFPVEKFPAVASLLDRVDAHPAYQRVMAIEAAETEAAGLTFP